MTKFTIATQVLKNVEAELERAIDEQKEAQSEANSHVGAMESRYDTFKEEAQYLAAAHGKRIQDLTRAATLMRWFSNLTCLIEAY